MEYIILYIIAFIPVILYDARNKVDAKNRYLIFEWLCLVCLMGFRYHVGGDSFSYEEMYDKYPTLSNFIMDDLSEKGYGILWNLFTITCRSITEEFWIQQLLVSVFVNISFFCFLKKHVQKYFTAIFIYIILYMFKYNTEILRASMAVGVFLFSFDYMMKKKWLRYYLLSAIAIMFHYEALVLLFFPFILVLDKIKINILTASIMFIVVYAIIQSLDALPFMNTLSAIDDNISTKIEGYGSKVQQLPNFVGLLFTFIVYYSPVCILIWLRRFKKDKINPFLILFIALGLLSSRWSHITGRLEDFIILIVIAAFVNQASIEISRFRRVIIKTSLVLYIFITLIINTIPLLPLIYPYHSIFDPVDENGRYELYLLKLSDDI